MYRKLQVIPLTCIPAVWGQCPVLSHRESPQGATLVGGWAAVAEDLMESILFLSCVLQHSLLGRLQCDGLMVATSLVH